MFSSLGYEVIKLRRESVAFLTCDGVAPGEYRFLTIKEVKMLYSLIVIDCYYYYLLIC